MVVLACESLYVCTVCTWRCEHARFVWRVFIRYIDIFIHAFQTKKEEKKEEEERGGKEEEEEEAKR